MKYSEFLHIAGLLNVQLSVCPLLYGSLGLEKRLSVDLNADYLKVYEASSKDGYRKNIKNKQDNIKISLIRKALESKGQIS